MRYSHSSIRDYKSDWDDSHGQRRHHRGLRWALLGTVSGIAIGLFSLTSIDANALRSKELSLPIPNTSAPAASMTDAADDSAAIELTNVEPVAAEATRPVESGSWHEVTIKSGDSLARIFSQQGVPPAQLQKVLDSGSVAKQLTQIYPGQTLKLRVSDTDELLELRYQIDALNEIQVLKTETGYQPELIARVPERRIIQRAATIDSSLFLAAKSEHLPENITMELAGIFGWDIDFALDIREGDQFAVVYEDLFLDGERIGTGNILAAEFTNQGNSYQAVRYTDSQGRTDYYTPEGRSMRKTFLRTPVAFTRISSRFSAGRKHPILNRIRAHKGVDYAAPRGTAVKATGSGKIVLRGKKGGYGNTIVIQHGSNYSTLYAHLNGYARGLKNGSRVKQGQIIGYVGSTGLATGPHLHYEFRINGVHRNPLTVKLPDAAPLPKQYLDDFKLATTNLVAQLENAKAQMVALQQDN